MAFPKRIERFRSYAAKAAPDIPTDIPLAIIWHESNGVVGQVSKGKPKAYPVPLRGGGEKLLDRALGLMQVIPRNIKARFDAGKQPPIFYEDMAGTDQRSAELQILFGCEILRGDFLHLHNYDPIAFPWPAGKLSEEQIRLGLMSYAYGQGRLEKKLDALRAAGAPLTAQELEARWPTWGKPKNNPIGFSKWMISKLEKHGGQPRPSVPPYDGNDRPALAGAGGGAALLLLALLVGSTWENRKT